MKRVCASRSSICYLEKTGIERRKITFNTILVLTRKEKSLLMILSGSWKFILQERREECEKTKLKILFWRHFIEANNYVTRSDNEIYVSESDLFQLEE